MQIQQLNLTAFRNIGAAEIRPAAGVNLFVGSNGQGKTSVLEAVSILASLRSFRDSKPTDWIQTQAERSALQAWVTPAATSTESEHAWKSLFEVNLERDPQSGAVFKTALLNGKRLKSGANFLKQKFGSAELAFHAISFNPSDHDLIRGEPALRRAHLDRVISAEDPEYLEVLLKYSKALEQRNALLKEQGGRYREILKDFTQPLIWLGAKIVQSRLRWLENNLEATCRLASSIAAQSVFLGLSYTAKTSRFNPSEIDQKSSEIGILSGVHFAGHHLIPSLEVLGNWLEKRFTAQESEELRQGVTLLGPHRDDWMIECQGQPLKGRGSQGEVRTALLALKLAEIESFRKVTGHRPILLLDDFSSELDLQRRQFLMREIEQTDLQVFVTSTDSSGLPGKQYRVDSGSVSEH